MFEKTLTDVVKGIRASKRDTALFISQCIAEIKTELSSADMHVKANALQKLTFLQMMGYSMNWASFATIEVMSSPRFAHKRIGYLAASQGFTQDTEVILLTTNLLQKELRGASITNASTNQDGVYEAGLAINCISNIVTADLAADLLPEMTQLTSHPSPYLRKKAILCLFKLFVHYPQGLRLTFGKLQACLQDPNPAVISCAVNVITELSDKNPKNYLLLAPAFFDLLTGSSNNWMLIKVVKLLGSLVPEEPRLARKLLEPLANIVRTTQAKSLLYEAVHTITLCLPYCPKPDGSLPAIVPEIVQLSAQTLRSLVEESDQNLKYLGLVGFGSLLQSHPRVLSSTSSSTEGGGGGDARPLILACLSDPDVTIRKRALDLLVGLATRKNVVDLVSQLILHVPLARGRGNYRQDLVAKILDICSNDKYTLLSSDSTTTTIGENHFEWYFNNVLLQLGYLLMVHGGGGSSRTSSPQRQYNPLAQRLHDEVINIALRVLPARTHAVQRSMEILLWGSYFSEDDTLSSYSGATHDDQDGSSHPGKQHYAVVPEILPALAWILGEYSDLLPTALKKANLPPLHNNSNNDDAEDSGPQLGASATSTHRMSLKGPYHAIVQVLSSPWNVQKLSTACQKVYLQAAVKIVASASGSATVAIIPQDQELESCLATLELNLPIFVQSVDVEVVERAFTALELLRALQLTSNSTSTAVPGLTRLDDGDDDDDDDGDDEKYSTTSGDLLGLDGSDKPAVGENTKTRGTRAESTSSPQLKRAHKVSTILTYLLKPSPMKPVSSKAQRKKQQSGPMGPVSVDVNAPLDMSVIQGLIDEEAAYLKQSNLSLESVSFTQQRPMPPTTTTTNTTADTTAGFIIASDPTATNSAAFVSSTGASFQNSPAAIGVSTQRRQGDPFYLDSAPSASATTNTSGLGASNPATEIDEQNRFGTAIQLPDDDGDDDEHPQNVKKSKKVKKKSKQSPSEILSAMTPSQPSGGTNYLNFDPHAALMAQTAPTSQGLGVSGVLPGFESVVTTQPQGLVATTAILDSGDEEEEDEQGKLKAKRRSKEYSNLSKIDLTRPLTVDEVMPPPNRMHREVVTGTQEQQVDSKKSKKQSKKTRNDGDKPKKKKDKTATIATPAPPEAAPVGDLLDLAFFGGSTSSTATYVTTTPAISSSVLAQPAAVSNPIGSAFDDLLSLGYAPAPAPTLPSSATGLGGISSQSVQPTPLSGFGGPVAAATATTILSTKKKASRPWIQGRIDSFNATGSTQPDWTQVRLSVRVYRSNQSGGSTAAAMLVVRVEDMVRGDGSNNHDSLFTGLVLDVANHGSIPLANAYPVAESQKVGPFQYPEADASFELTGTLRWSGSSEGFGSVPVMIVLPATLHLTPLEGLQLEQVAEELALESFHATSAKIEMSSGGAVATAHDFDTMKQILCNFLRVAPVLESSPHPKAATFAASSARGAKVRVLMKHKDSNNNNNNNGAIVKVDFRCTNAALGNALVADVKHLLIFG